MTDFALPSGLGSGEAVSPLRERLARTPGEYLLRRFGAVASWEARAVPRQRILLPAEIVKLVNATSTEKSLRYQAPGLDLEAEAA